MKKERLFVFFLIVVLLLFVMSGTAVAAPIVGGHEQLLLMSEESVNLPGWVGGLLTIIALALPLAFRAWTRQK